jgi:hypothetical protein
MIVSPFTAKISSASGQPSAGLSSQFPPVYVTEQTFPLVVAVQVPAAAKARDENVTTIRTTRSSLRHDRIVAIPSAVM